MERLRTLFDVTKSPAGPVLPPDLHHQYGGGLLFPQPFPDRPYVLGNFVSTLDGVVSYLVTGRSGGGDISGNNEADRFIMGLLRASADAVIIGAGTLHATAPSHRWTAESIYPAAADWYRRYRKEVLGKPGPPLTVIATASGIVDLQHAVFHAPEVPVRIITTPKGRERLEAAQIDKLGSTQVSVLSESNVLIAPESILRFLHSQLGIRLLLHEGGPTLFGQFVEAGLVDEFFLTLAPQLAGRSTEQPRPGFLAGTAFVPETAPWLQLLSLKQSGSHLYLRYARRATMRES